MTFTEDLSEIVKKREAMERHFYAKFAESNHESEMFYLRLTEKMGKQKPE